MQDVAISLADGPYNSGSTQGLYHPNHQVNKHTIMALRSASNRKRTAVNRPFPNYLWPHFQSEPRYSSIHMKISFHLHLIENLCSHEMLSTRTRFEKEAQGNSEMAQNFGFDLFSASNLPGSFIHPPQRGDASLFFFRFTRDFYMIDQVIIF